MENTETVGCFKKESVAKKYSAALIHGLFMIPDTQCFGGGPRMYSKSDMCVTHKCLLDIRIYKYQINKMR